MNNEKRQLQEQLDRCLKWLEVEPDDSEVIDKAKELEAKIQEIENQEIESQRLKDKENLEKEILELRKSINSEIRDFKHEKKLKNSSEPMLQDLYKMYEMIRPVRISLLDSKINRYNNLAKEYQEKYM